jgi:hypothetical protein
VTIARQTFTLLGVAGMDNWNYEKAKQFVASIENELTRYTTDFFLNELVILVLQRYSAPESDFDLLFYVKIISRVVSDSELMRMILNREPLDVGWQGVADAFTNKNTGR